ncbi:MAG: AtpZ/AtpI family protein [Pyrinomonadaceae bacterium]|nr:AtpZ/AtpI family protein [Pyrinomonadaceae bacterium]
MIKSLFEPDAHQPENISIETEKVSDDAIFEVAAAPRSVEVNEAENPLEMPELPNDAPAASDANELSDAEMLELFAEAENEPVNLSEPQFNEPENKSAEAKDDSSDIEFKEETASFRSPAESADETVNFQFAGKAKISEPKKESEQLLFQTPPERESFAETARKSGLAYAAAITLFASVVFMLIIGWFADLLFDSSPWGKVGGIVLGSLIGFIQLFRITAQIFKNNE